jgi:hypothetical protein
MKKNLLILFVISISINALSQQTEANSKDVASVVSDLSYFWKLDSLANNGFRLCTYKRIIDAKSDSNTVSRGFLSSKLGKPNRVLTSNKGIEWIYFVLDGKKMAKEYAKTSEECVYISFLFDKYERYLLSTYSGVIDY